MSWTWRVLRAPVSLVCCFFNPVFLQFCQTVAHPACNSLSFSHFFSFFFFYQHKEKGSVPVREAIGCRWHASAKKGSVVVYLFRLFVCVSQFSRSTFPSWPADERLSTVSWLKSVWGGEGRGKTAGQGAAGYLEEGLLHSEAGQQNWWAMSSSSSSLPTNRRMSRERKAKRDRDSDT